MSRFLSRTLVFLASLAALVLGGSAMEASASTATSVAESAAAVTPAATCSYTVRWPQAGVYDLPSHSSTLFKVKYANETVTGPCLTLVREGNRWTAVYCGCDPDGRAWMRSDALLQR